MNKMKKKIILIISTFGILLIFMTFTAFTFIKPQSSIVETDQSYIAKITPMPCNVTCTIIHNSDGSVDMFVPANQ
ncbi:MAG: hypothetical protein Q8942_05525 [Bacillota bacterium]|nr:hypothetical protein [Bacillota bacterium]